MKHEIVVDYDLGTMCDKCGKYDAEIIAEQGDLNGECYASATLSLWLVCSVALLVAFCAYLGLK